MKKKQRGSVTSTIAKPVEPDPLQKALLEFFKTLNEASTKYQSAREQVHALRKMGLKPGVLVPLPACADAGIPPGKRAILRNNWNGKNEVFAGGYTRRWEIHLV